MYCAMCVPTHMHACSYVCRAMYVRSYSFEGHQVEGSQLVAITMTVLLSLAMDHSLCSGVCLIKWFVWALLLYSFPL